MFLNQLSNPLQKALFLELAMLVMMASHDDDASEQIAEYNSDALLSKFLASINTKEAEMLEKYQEELSDKDDDFVQKALDKNYKSFFLYERNGFSSYLNEDEDKYKTGESFPTLSWVLKKTLMKF